VKLYTEEQVLEIIANINRDVNVSSQELLEGIEVDHIELPSDEEIYYAETQMPMNTFELGAKWMRDKLQGGEQ
jgi:hypothetical protein